MAPTNTMLNDAHHAPVWVKMSPFFAMLLGVGRGLADVHRSTPALPGTAGAGNQRPLYLFLLNKWYFDELYDCDLRAARPLPWRASVDGAATATSSTGPSTGLHGHRAVLHPPRRALAVRLPVPLRLRHGDRHRGPDHLDGPDRRGQSMDNLLSIVTFLPLVAALVAGGVPAGRRCGGAAQRQVAGAVRHLGDLPDLAVRSASSSTRPTPASRWSRSGRWLVGLHYKMGVDGISVLFVMLTTFLMPLTIAACWT